MPVERQLCRAQVELTHTSTGMQKYSGILAKTKSHQTKERGSDDGLQILRSGCFLQLKTTLSLSASLLQLTAPFNSTKKNQKVNVEKIRDVTVISVLNACVFIWTWSLSPGCLLRFLIISFGIYRIGSHSEMIFHVLCFLHSSKGSIPLS